MLSVPALLLVVSSSTDSDRCHVISTFEILLTGGSTHPRVYCIIAADRQDRDEAAMAASDRISKNT